jgi:5-methylcytosine-specific restriction endonuclease McrA
MKNKQVWVEIENSKFVRIFKSKNRAIAANCEIMLVDYFHAVSRIRHHLWRRCKGECELCASVVTEDSGHMHEQKHRGKGGEISLANSVFICSTCHAREHADRNPKFSKKRLTNNSESGTLISDSNTPGPRVHD